jgi:hypothetical protein
MAEKRSKISKYVKTGVYGNKNIGVWTYLITADTEKKEISVQYTEPERGDTEVVLGHGPGQEITPRFSPREIESVTWENNTDLPALLAKFERDVSLSFKKAYRELTQASYSPTADAEKLGYTSIDCVAYTDIVKAVDSAAFNLRDAVKRLGLDPSNQEYVLAVRVAENELTTAQAVLDAVPQITIDVCTLDDAELAK